MKKLLMTLILATGVSSAVAAPIPAPWNEGYGPTAHQESARNKRAVTSESTANSLLQRDINSVNNNEQMVAAHEQANSQQPAKTFVKFSGK
ncbi:hypothetical protein [Neisseria sp. Ec49-e6-T10]|uniref:hypothetical protein n=1 Tax=Neisseria sp. Ec49-e6-T10 TaxID=3140744 RepID=UPI003EBBA439